MQYIKIGGRERPILFGMAALYHYEQRTGRKALSDFSKMSANPEDETEGISLLFLVDLIYSGLAAGARKEVPGSVLPFQPEDVAEWVGDDFALIEQVMTIFAESFPTTKKNTLESLPTTQKRKPKAQ